MISWSRYITNATPYYTVEWPRLKTLLEEVVQALRAGTVSASFPNKNCQASCSMSSFLWPFPPVCVEMLDILVCIFFFTVRLKNPQRKPKFYFIFFFLFFFLPVFGFWDSLIEPTLTPNSLYHRCWPWTPDTHSCTHHWRAVRTHKPQHAQFVPHVGGATDAKQVLC